MTPPLTKFKLEASLVLMVTLGACAPIPHYEVVLPSISGKIHRNGEPVTDAIVYFEYPEPENNSCAFKSEIYTRTNNEGLFQFEERKQLSFFVFMDKWVTGQVCIADGNARYQGWYEHRLGGYPSEIRLDCNLENKPHERQEGSLLHTKGICTD